MAASNQAGVLLSTGHSRIGDNTYENNLIKRQQSYRPRSLCLEKYKDNPAMIREVIETRMMPILNEVPLSEIKDAFKQYFNTDLMAGIQGYVDEMYPFKYPNNTEIAEKRQKKQAYLTNTVNHNYKTDVLKAYIVYRLCELSGVSDRCLDLDCIVLSPYLDVVEKCIQSLEGVLSQ